MQILFREFEKKVQDSPFSLAIITPELQASYQELHHLLLNAIDLLTQHNIQAGDRVGLYFNRPVNHFVAALACLYKGCTQLPLHKGSTKTQLVSYTNTTHCKVLLNDTNIEINTLSTLQFTLKTLATQRPHNSLTQTAFNYLPEHIAILIIGSGTTGNSKIIPITFEALEIQIKRDISIHNLQEDERFLALSPISYYTSLRRMLACLQTHACAAFIDIGKDNILNFCIRVKIDHLSLVMAHAQYLSSKLQGQTKNKPRLPYLKTLFIGASPISQQIRSFLQNEISPNVFIFYGPNEIGPVCCAHLNHTNNKEGTIGLPINDIKVEIVNKNNEPCELGETGRVRIKAEGLCKQYEEEGASLSQESFIDGWFYPKDLAFIDNDGHIIFQGREDDLIIYYGNNIYPRQIEEVLEQHPSVKEAAAFAVLNKNGEQAPVAVITLNDTIDAEDKDLAAKIKKFCDEKLRFSSPTLIKIVKELPKNAAGKILKRELKEKFFPQTNPP